MVDYNKLINKYNHEYVHGEKRSQEYEDNLRWEAKMKHRMLLVDQLTLEAKYLLLKNYQKEDVKLLVKIFNKKFQELHRHASDETIILSFIFYVKKLETSKIQLKNYSISKKYKLTDYVFELILCRMNNYFMLSSPLIVQETFRDNHDELVRTGNHN